MSGINWMVVVAHVLAFLSGLGLFWGSEGWWYPLAASFYILLSEVAAKVLK